MHSYIIANTHNVCILDKNHINKKNYKGHMPSTRFLFDLISFSKDLYTYTHIYNISSCLRKKCPEGLDICRWLLWMCYRVNKNITDSYTFLFVRAVKNNYILIHTIQYALLHSSFVMCPNSLLITIPSMYYYRHLNYDDYIQCYNIISYIKQLCIAKQ